MILTMSRKVMMTSKEPQYNIDMAKTYTDRFDKLQWIKENATEKHVIEMFLTELVNWLEEDEFDKFFKFHCRLWKIETPFDEDEDEDPIDNFNYVGSHHHY